MSGFIICIVREILQVYLLLLASLILNKKSRSDVTDLRSEGTDQPRLAKYNEQTSEREWYKSKVFKRHIALSWRKFSELILESQGE